MFVFLFLGFCAQMHVAHDAPFKHSFYKDKTVPGTMVSCCTKKDCQSLEGYRMLPGGEYEILMPEGYWYKPEKRIVRVDVTPDAKAHACWTDATTAAYSARKRTVFCVWIPIMFM